MRDIVGNWVEVRLWRQLAERDREFLLDVGLLDWIDAEILDEALAGTNLLHRLQAMAEMSGLIEPVRGSNGKSFRLHTLIKEHCTARRQEETPKRYRMIHLRLATALAHRGRTVDAMRHAVEAQDPMLAGRILVDHGGVRMWLRDGSVRLIEADRFLSEEALKQYPQLTLVRTVALTLQGKFQEARRMLLATSQHPDCTGDNWDLEADRYIAEGILRLSACDPVGSEPLQQLASNVMSVLDSGRVQPPVRACLMLGFSYLHNAKAEFDQAQQWAKRSRQWLSKDTHYLKMAADFQAGEIAMAQGRITEAESLYRSGQRAAKQYFVNDPRLVAYGALLVRELDLERNRITVVADSSTVPRAYWRTGSRFSSYSAASAIAIDLVQSKGSVDDACSLVNEILEYAYQAGLLPLVRLLGALRVDVLAQAGRIGEAESSWKADALPLSSNACLDLTAQSWREMEAIACARLRVHAGRGALDSARELLRDLLDLSLARGLRRTEMRALALGVALEESAGDSTAAQEHLTVFLERFRESDYARPLLREKDATIAALTAYLDANPESPHASNAEALLASCKASEMIVVPELSSREREILDRLETQSYREIAVAIGISRSGVRYHIGRLFDKLNVHHRNEIVDTARSLGFLPPQAE